MLNGLMSRVRWVRLPHPLLSPGSAAGERRFDRPKVRGSTPRRGTHGAVDELGESPALQAGHVAGSSPVGAAIPS